MGQQEIYDYLKKHRGWVTVAEIANAIKSPNVHVRRGLKKMLKYREVFCKDMKINLDKGWYISKRLVTHWKLR